MKPIYVFHASRCYSDGLAFSHDPNYHMTQTGENYECIPLGTLEEFEKRLRSLLEGNEAVEYIHEG